MATNNAINTGSMTDGQLIIGSTGTIPTIAALTGTANQTVVTNAAGSITLSLPQSIATSSGVTFDNASLTGGFPLKIGPSTVGVSKTSRLTIVEYDGVNACAMLVSVMNTTTNTLTWGGGTGSRTAATSHLFNAAATNGVFTGTTIYTININGCTLNSGNLTLSPLTASRPLKLDGSKNVTATQIDLASTNDITGVVALANGGTNKALTASNGGIIYSDTDSFEVLAGTATAGQILRSGSSAAPSWSTATYPATTTINEILFSSAANTVTGLAGPGGNSVLVSTSAGVPIWSAAMTDGRLVIGNSAGTPTAATLTGTANQVTVTNGAGSITLSLPQSIDTAATVTFGTVKATDGVPLVIGPSTVNVAKTSRFGIVEYDGVTVASMLVSVMDATNNTLNWGGGNALQTAATSHKFYAAAAIGTTTGTLISTTDTTGITLNSGDLNLSPLTASTSIYLDASKNVKSLALTNGQLQIGSTGAIPVAATLTEGSGISITNGAGSITISEVVSTENSITAFAGGGQASATQLTARTSRITVVGTAGDSVKLPSSPVVGLSYYIRNDDAAESSNVFPQSGGSINALGVDAAYALAAGTSVIMIPFSSTVWYSFSVS